MPTYLVDTNILLRLVDTEAAEYPLVAGALRSLLARQMAVHIVPQAIYEFWAVATRPLSVNGLGWDWRSVRAEVDVFQSNYALLPDVPGVYESWLELVSKHQVKGKQVHDARLVAAMRAHGLTHLLTLNTKDFERYSEITAIHPGKVEQ